MDPRHLSRLYEEQRKAIDETRETIQKYEKFKSDYKALQQRLKTLPDKVSHDVMVPFGKYAFMPGQIVHTNEILVLLGDNWFAERSAKQAYHIAERRIQELDSRIRDLREQHDLLAPRLGLTSDLQAEAQGFGDIKEIVEEFDVEKERLWDEQHRKNVRRYRAEQAKKTISIGKVKEEMKSDSNAKSHEDLWKRLDALEEQEAEKGELNSSFEEDSDGEEDKDSKRPSKQRVSWVDEKLEPDGNNDASSSDDDSVVEHAESREDSSGEETVAAKDVKRVITFNHTKTPPSLKSPTQASHAGDSLNISSPGDIYKLFAPKSILKKSHSKPEETEDLISKKEHLHPKRKSNQTSFMETKVIDELNDDDPGSKSKNLSCGSEEKAFTGLVVEKKPIPQNQQNSTLPQRPSGTQEAKKTSKFRAQRLKQNPS